ncbi:MAG: DEAD/DEAH box helicase family protein [Planctomycetota bacterium]|nr:DEAD/DEAH box helicase family protein [Planctomycetota bacterium]
MATGSGKTLIMHINYRQFLRYNDLPLDNILLITPNEGLSEQHIEEMTASSIPCLRFDLNESGLGMSEPDAVRVIEITKLVEEKRGGGVSVPVEAFEGNNLIFVDEGHKGSGGEAWRSFRDALGQTGFTFEYSATFGQALTAARNDELTEEYGKAIIFDYSYRYFHGDGYGKDFRILNLKEETTEDKTETLLLGNLLSFYEQQRMFEESGEELRPYNLEKPLWVFVGSSVNAVYTENKQKRSDVLTVARFLHHLLENKRGWAVKAIKKLLDGKTGLVDPDGQDIFAGKFQYLKGRPRRCR